MFLRKLGERKELEGELSELRERCDRLEKMFEEAVEKTERIEKGVRLLTEAIYKIITYLKELEDSMEGERAVLKAKSQMTTIVEKYEKNKELTETEKKLIEEVKKGASTVKECCELAKISKEHASRLLKQLVDKNILIREKRGKTFYYRPLEK